jgi:hypothetical protein
MFVGLCSHNEVANAFRISSLSLGCFLGFFKIAQEQCLVLWFKSD